MVLDDPYDDPEGLSAHIPDRSPEPTPQQLDVSSEEMSIHLVQCTKVVVHFH